MALSEEEYAAAIDKAKMDKYWRLDAQRKADEKRRFQESIARPFTKPELWAYACQLTSKRFGVDLVEDDENSAAIKALLAYFTEDPSFNALGAGFRLDKGLLLMGNVGTGKTLLMKAFSRNKRQCYNVVSCRSLADGYSKDGMAAVEPFFEPQFEAAGDFRIFNQRQLGRCFDDLGAEGQKKSYGNEVNVMADIILARYDLRHEFPWNQTHITTNLENGDEIEAMYGTRVRDRMREMFNVITLDGESRRRVN